MNVPSIFTGSNERLEAPASLLDMRDSFIADAKALVDIGVQTEAPDIISEPESATQVALSHTASAPAEVPQGDSVEVAVYDQLAQLRAERAAQASVGDAYVNPGPALTPATISPATEQAAAQVYDIDQLQAARKSVEESIDELRAA
jgi:hypothetical protein